MADGNLSIPTMDLGDILSTTVASIGEKVDAVGDNVEFGAIDIELAFQSVSLASHKKGLIIAKQNQETDTMSLKIATRIHVKKSPKAVVTDGSPVPGGSVVKTDKCVVVKETKLYDKTGGVGTLLTTLDPGAIVFIVKDYGYNLKVKTLDGKVGYVDQSQVDIITYPASS